MASSVILLKILVSGVIIVAGSILVIWGAVKGFQGLIWLITNLARGLAFLVVHTYRFVRNTIVDTLRSVGAILTALVLLPLTVLNFLFGRWRTGSHYAQALEDELIAFALGIYRVALGNPLHFVGMGILTDGFERRLPEVVARAPRAPRGSVKDGKFDGYKVTGVLPAGGSGARLFLAKPRSGKLQELLAAGHPDPGQVVIKAFSLSAGSTLPQIVRESRALESARNLGLVLEHELTDRSFYYVMPYVPGDNLDVVVSKMHDEGSATGLTDRQLRVVMGLAGDLLYTLDTFHNGGLWHKDIKPSNVIVSGGRAHLVDLGLVTPLESAMTLTTHGTEYFRDPEMVRLALKGVKVHEVNGVKFDIYSVGAVLYAMIENSFPAQGSLSSIGRRCPEALRWIVRRAMADLDMRYGSAREMLGDLRAVLAARDPFAVRPADLPSVSGVDTWSLAGAAFDRPSGGKAPGPLHASGAPLGSIDTATAVKVRRRSTSRSLLAAAVTMLFLAGAAGLAIMAAEERGPFATGHEPAQRDWISALPSLEEAAASAEDASRAAQRHFDSLRRTWSRDLDKALSQVRHETRRASHHASGTAPSSGTLLLLQDLSPATDREPVRALCAELEAQGFEVLGNPADGIGDERDILYLAGARKAVGVSDPGDEEARARLGEYLADNPSLDGLIWLSSGERPEDVVYRFIRPLRRGAVESGSFGVAGR